MTASKFFSKKTKILRLIRGISIARAARLRECEARNAALEVQAERRLDAIFETERQQKAFDDFKEKALLLRKDKAYDKLRSLSSSISQDDFSQQKGELIVPLLNELLIVKARKAFLQGDLRFVTMFSYADGIVIGGNDFITPLMIGGAFVPSDNDVAIYRELGYQNHQFPWKKPALRRKKRSDCSD